MTTTVDKPILKWQLERLVKELVLLQGHASDPTCPCDTEGEYCTRKHLLTLEAYAEETEPMADEELRAELQTLAREARECRDAEERMLCGEEPADDTDLAQWARDWRKVFEEGSIACRVVVEAPQPPETDTHTDIQPHTLFNAVQHATTCELVGPQQQHLVSWFEAYGSESLFAVEVEQTGRKIDEVMRQLEDGIKGILESDAYMQHLLAMSRFRHYSLGNIMLIALQCPHATYVAGYRTWQDLGRYVRKGEKGIAILAPCLPAGKSGKVPLRQVTPGAMVELDGKPYSVGQRRDGTVPVRSPDGTETILDADTMVKLMGPVMAIGQPRYFKVVYVFDISQTEGQDLPTIEVPTLSGDVSPELWHRIMDYASSLPITVSFEARPALDPQIKGSWNPTTKELWVKPDEPRTQQAKTALHELAHSHTSDEPVSTQDHETIAESVAFVVAARFGFDTGVRSFPYVALWAQHIDTLKVNLETIRRVSVKMVDAMETLPRVEGELYDDSDFTPIGGAAAVAEGSHKRDYPRRFKVGYWYGREHTNDWRTVTVAPYQTLSSKLRDEGITHVFAVEYEGAAPSLRLDDLAGSKPSGNPRQPPPDAIEHPDYYEVEGHYLSRVHGMALSPCEVQLGLARKLDSCVTKVEDRNVEKGCPARGRGTSMCPNPYAVCRASISVPRCGAASPVELSEFEKAHPELLVEA